MRPKNKMRRPAPAPAPILNNNTADYRYSQQYTDSPTGITNSSPNFHCYPPAVYAMHGSSGNAYIPGSINIAQNNNNDNNSQKIQACAPTPVYVNAPPKPRRSTNMAQPQTMMVTGLSTYFIDTLKYEQHGLKNVYYTIGAPA